jgi:hypothetical protein
MTRRKLIYLILGITGLCVLCTSCGGIYSATPEDGKTAATSRSITETAVPTMTAKPTHTLTPTLTATATATLAPIPTDTSVPPKVTSTPEPTDTQPVPTTAVPPTAVPPTAVPPTAAPPTAAPPTTAPPTTAPTAQPAQSGSGFKLLSMTDTVRVNGTARVTIETEPGTGCVLLYRTPAGTQSQAQGLGRITANKNGVCQWSWKIGPSTKPGVGQVTISAGDQTQNYPITIK